MFQLQSSVAAVETERWTMSSSCSLTWAVNFPPICPKHFSRYSTAAFPKSLSSSGGGSRRKAVAALKARVLGFSGGSFYEGGGGFGSEEDPPSDPSEDGGSGVGAAVEDKEAPQCPPGLRHYETMAVLRPDMSEDERLSLTQKYEELLVAGGGMYLEVFNRGVIPLAYPIRKRNKAGETNTYLDGIYLLFTYFTKPESTKVLEFTLNTDDDVIRSSSFKVRKRRY